MSIAIGEVMEMSRNFFFVAKTRNICEIYEFCVLKKILISRVLSDLENRKN